MYLKIKFTTRNDESVEIKGLGSPDDFNKFKERIGNHSASLSTFSNLAFTIPIYEFCSLFKVISEAIDYCDIVDIETDSVVDRLIKSTQETINKINQNTKALVLTKPQIIKKLTALKFVRSLKYYQARNISKLVAAPQGASFSVPGAGKTTEALACYALLTNKTQGLFIICPPNAFISWEEQAKQCLPEIQFVRLNGGVRNIVSILRKKPKFCLISYSQLGQVSAEVVSHLKNIHSMLILDESHKIKKGESGVWAREVFKIAPYAERRMVLSGTPCPNTEEDLVPQIKFLFPHLPLDIKSPRQVIKRFYVRTTKKELGLRKINIVPISIELNQSQKNFYDHVSSVFKRDASSYLKTRDRSLLRNINKSYMQLLQIVSNPGLLARYESEFSSSIFTNCLVGDSPKIQYAVERARNLAKKGKKVLIWTTFVANVEIISRRLSDIGSVFIHGGVDTGSEYDENTREYNIKQFKYNKNVSVLVANPAACGESISLHDCCHNAIYIDRNYNAGQYLQSQDRIHRIGLSKNQETYIELLISPETIDESVERRLNLKQNRMAEILNDRGLRVNLSDNESDDFPDIDDIRDIVKQIK
jgi:hypothetical protein